MTTKAARTAVIQAVRDHESARRLHDLTHLGDRLLVLAEQTMDLNPNIYPVNSFKLDGWRTEIRSIRSVLEQEITRLKKFHRAVAASVRD